MVFDNKMLVNEILMFLGFNLRDIQLSQFFEINNYKYINFSNILTYPSIEICVEILKISHNIGKFIVFLDKINPLKLPQIFNNQKKNIS